MGTMCKIVDYLGHVFDTKKEKVLRVLTAGVMCAKYV